MIFNANSMGMKFRVEFADKCDIRRMQRLTGAISSHAASLPHLLGQQFAFKRAHIEQFVNLPLFVRISIIHTKGVTSICQLNSLQHIFFVDCVSAICDIFVWYLRNTCAFELVFYAEITQQKNKMNFNTRRTRRHTHTHARVA